jgi:hypothetical protein
MFTSNLSIVLGGLRKRVIIEQVIKSTQEFKKELDWSLLVTQNMLAHKLFFWFMAAGHLLEKLKPFYLV